jgi:hypothetical protein
MDDLVEFFSCSAKKKTKMIEEGENGARQDEGEGHVRG